MATMAQLNDIEIPKIDADMFPDFPEFPMSNICTRYDNFIQQTQSGQDIVKIFENDQRVAKLKGKMIARGDGAQCFEIETLVQWYVWCVNKSAKIMP